MNGKKTFLGVIVLAMVFGLIFVGCPDKDDGGDNGDGQKLTGYSDLEFTVINGGTAYSVSGLSSEQGGKLNIPAYYRPNVQSDYLPVTSIGNKAFSGHINITGITIPDSVTSIGAGAFNRCTGINSITIPASVTSVTSAYDDALFQKFPDDLFSDDILDSLYPDGVFRDWTSSQTINVPWKADNKPSGWSSRWNKACNAEIVYKK